MTSPGNRPTPSWFDISTPDAPRAHTFYQGVFGWSVTAIDETYALLGEGGENAGGPPAGGIGQAGPESPYVGIVAYFPVDDVAAALDRAEKLGATRTMEPSPTPMGTIAVFTDPDGNRVGLRSS
jgi:uncharacterized protein